MLSTWPARWNALPREGRDTLFLLLVVAWVLLLQAGHVPAWCLGLAGATLAWRAWLTVRLRPLPGLWARAALLLLATAATYLTHQTILGRDAGVTLIVVLLALKTLEMRARRDAFVVFFLAFFTLLTHFFYSQSLPAALGILLALWGLLTALVNAHLPVGRPPLWQAARLAGAMALLGAPVMLALFLLFPRMAPLWGIPGDGMTGRSGLSPTLRVGSVAQLALDDSVVMRIQFENGVTPPQRELYFRGPVLSRFDGREWRPAAGLPQPHRERPDAPLDLSGQPLRYQVTLEPSNRPWLLVLDASAERPAGLPGPAPLFTTELQWLLHRPITDVMRYDAVSHPAFRYGPRQATPSLQAFTELPPGFNPRTLELARQMRQSAPGAGAAGWVEQALRRLREGGYSYTLEPGVYGEHTADEFWFDRKAGFCEHIASAFVVLMRALDVPARLVTGYQGGEINPVDRLFTVRQADAHAWAEVWLPGQGWTRVDPTGAVAPGRTGASQRLRAEPGLFGQAVLTVSPNVAARLRAVWEAVNHRWNGWVLNYTQSRQLDLLRRLGWQARDWTDLARALTGLLAALAAAGALWALWERRPGDPWLGLLEQARRRLRRAGCGLPAQATPRQMAARLPADWPPSQREPIRAWLLRMEGLRYAAAPAPGTGEAPGRRLATLRREFSRLPWPPASRPPAAPPRPT